MSIKWMSAVWENGPEDKAELIVLLALADFANDAGDCWPSMPTIGRKARMSERNARRVIRKLEDDGYIKTVSGGGRHGCSQYRINPDKMSPGQNVPTGQIGQETRTKRAQNPDIAMSAEPSENRKEPSNSNDAREVAELLEIYASPSSVASFMAYRRKSKAKGLTLTAAKRLASNLRAIAERGGDPDDALGLAEERVWLTVDPDWYFNAKGKQRDNRTRQDFTPSGVPDDPALRAIFAAAGAFKA